MQTPVKCDCGKLTGVAAIAQGGEPAIMYKELKGDFRIARNLPYCLKCNRPPTGNEWRND